MAEADASRRDGGGRLTVVSMPSQGWRLMIGFVFGSPS